MTDAITRLESWKYARKDRAVEIDIDDGYGSSAWHVMLKHNKGFTSAVEYCVPREGYVSVGDIDGDWPGLAATIHAAIDGFERGVFREKR